MMLLEVESEKIIVFFPLLLTMIFPFLISAGWGEMPAVHAKPEASWGEPSSPSAAVDNGTSAWGKPPSSGTGWGDNSAESAGTYGRASAPAAAPALCKPGECVCICVCACAHVHTLIILAA